MSSASPSLSASALPSPLASAVSLLAASSPAAAVHRQLRWTSPRAPPSLPTTTMSSAPSVLDQGRRRVRRRIGGVQRRLHQCICGRCRRIRHSLPTAATPLPLSRCAPPPRFTLLPPPLTLPLPLTAANLALLHYRAAAVTLCTAATLRAAATAAAAAAAAVPPPSFRQRRAAALPPPPTSRCCAATTAADAATAATLPPSCR